MRLALILLAAAVGFPAAAQTREQTLSNLAFLMGESHGLRQLCQGPGDQYWRKRMERIIELEAPDPVSRAPLAEHFNDGFTAARRQHARCSAESRADARSVAARGQALAGLLAQPMAPR